jgi:hypothetical protein
MGRSSLPASRTFEVVLMPASRTHPALITERPVDGLLLAPIDGDPWAALHALRRAMVDMRLVGLDPYVAYVLTVNSSEFLAHGLRSKVPALVVGFRLS